MSDRWDRVSAAPTNPGLDRAARPLSAEDLFAAEAPAAPPALDEKARQVYYWIVNQAIISPYYDIEFSQRPPLAIELGDAGAQVTLPDEASYSSNVLIPLLTFLVGGKCLLVGGPGRGKTTVAVLMGVLAGTAPADVRRAVQQGQPQLSVSDLVGIPLPADLVKAERLTDIRIAWREWLTRPVKIVDEYNRIPTKTQSALLTMVAEGYVESHDQMRRTSPHGGVESWFFTANDDAGGGTFPVIKALRDRMDVTVQAASFNSRFFDELITRVEAGEKPEEHVPGPLLFTPAEQEHIRAEIRSVPIPAAVRARLRFFFSHFEFAQHGGRRFEYRTKDVVTTAGRSVSEAIEANDGADLEADLGAQTVNGLSVRALQTLILYAKAMAWFRGASQVSVQDAGAVLPFALYGKLEANRTHPRFDIGAEPELLSDALSWLGDLFARSCREQDQHRGTDDPVAALLQEFGTGLSGVSALEASRRITAVETQLRRIAETGKLYGRDFDDVVTLKYLHQRYTAYVRWARSQP